MNSREVEPLVNVGVLNAPEISFSLTGTFVMECAGQKNEVDSKEVFTATFENGKILFMGKLYDQILFSPVFKSSSFALYDVKIGIDFHWERLEEQQFSGALKLIPLNGMVQAVNCVLVEEYLTSVISSEMSATSSLALLKAHAIISRSWLLNKLYNKKLSLQQSEFRTFTEDGTEKFTRWQDHLDHTDFDVCADDHCQRYQGITKVSSPTVAEAIKETYGKVLFFDGKICDARFYKACGGVTEYFENCWEEVRHPYLVPVKDDFDNQEIPDLTDEKECEKWLLSAPKAFCNTTVKAVLSEVLNNYDQETPDFYRWQLEYSQEELTELVRRKSGVDFGLILDLIPKKRGASGRIIELEIVGANKRMIVGKELEIRKYLSPSHLYSSAFIVKKTEREGKLFFVLNGAGWGHGVGLCQIGAAVMAHQGYNHVQILNHYYPNAEIKKIY
jgi:SpoIID/LytB domain protein